MAVQHDPLDGLTPSEIARLAVEEDPVRIWLESRTHAESLRLAKAVRLAPNLETCVALLQGQPVPLSRLDLAWAHRYGHRPHAA